MAKLSGPKGLHGRLTDLCILPTPKVIQFAELTLNPASLRRSSAQASAATDPMAMPSAVQLSRPHGIFVSKDVTCTFRTASHIVSGLYSNKRLREVIKWIII